MFKISKKWIYERTTLKHTDFLREIELRLKHEYLSLPNFYSDTREYLMKITFTYLTYITTCIDFIIGCSQHTDANYVHETINTIRTFTAEWCGIQTLARIGRALLNDNRVS